jgi:hypothetical protein
VDEAPVARVGLVPEHETGVDPRQHGHQVASTRCVGGFLQRREDGIDPVAARRAARLRVVEAEVRNLDGAGPLAPRADYEDSPRARLNEERAANPFVRVRRADEHGRRRCSGDGTGEPRHEHGGEAGSQHRGSGRFDAACHSAPPGHDDDQDRADEHESGDSDEQQAFSRSSTRTRFS